LAIVGLGVAGGYLAARLARETSHEVHGFDMLQQVDTKCAWGGSKHELGRITNQVEIDFSQFIFFEGKKLQVFFEDGHQLLIPIIGLVTFDKDGLERALLQKATEAGARVNRGKKVRLEDLGGFDLVIDATGVFRSMLPKIENDMIFPNLEYRVEYDSNPPFDDFSVFPYSGLGGYSWFFPLNDKTAHVGGGDRFHRQKHYVEQFMRKYGGRPFKTIARPVRMVPPTRCEPIYVRKGSQSLVGVGESIGAVFPLLGEGIIPSLQSADILIESFGSKDVDAESYRKGLRKKFFYFEPIFKAILAKWGGNWSAALHAPSLLPSFVRVKKMEKRFGFEIRLSDLVEIFNRT
jgi:flavin-dependent dehydrogenase